MGLGLEVVRTATAKPLISNICYEAKEVLGTWALTIRMFIIMSDKRWRSLFSSFVSAPAIIRSHSLRRKRAGHLIRTRMACPQGRPALSDHAGHTIAPDDDDEILSNVHFVRSSSSYTPRRFFFHFFLFPFLFLFLLSRLGRPT